MGELRINPAIVIPYTDAGSKNRVWWPIDFRHAIVEHQYGTTTNYGSFQLTITPKVSGQLPRISFLAFTTKNGAGITNNVYWVNYNAAGTSGNKWKLSQFISGQDTNDNKIWIDGDVLRFDLSSWASINIWAPRNMAANLVITEK